MHRRLVWTVGAMFIAALLGALAPPVQARGKAAAVVADVVGLPVPRPFALPVGRSEERVGGVDGDLYTSGRSAPPLLLVPGATPAGRDDARVIDLAEALAAAGRTVFVPELALYRQDFVETDLERIVRAGVGLDDHPLSAGALVLVGISYGGSCGLVAAAEPRLGERLALVATFGAYWDLVGVLQAATTGVSLVEGQAIPWDADPRAEAVVREQATDLAPEGDREALAAALDGDRDPATLPPAAAAIHAVVDNDDPALTYPLAARLPEPVRARLAAFSPSSAAADLTVPVVALHSVDDPAVPYGEALRLEAGLDDVRLWTVGQFRHVDFQAGRWAEVTSDAWRTWRFGNRVLAGGEGWWPVRWRAVASLGDNDVAG